MWVRNPPSVLNRDNWFQPDDEKKAQVEGSTPSRSTLSTNPPLVFLLEG